MGNKFGTSNMWRYTATSAEGLAIAKAAKFHIDKRKREERERKESMSLFNAHQSRKKTKAYKNQCQRRAKVSRM